MTGERCKHVFKSTHSHEDGTPVFKPYNNQIVAHVACIHCGARTFLTSKQYYDLPETGGEK